MVRDQRKEGRGKERGKNIFHFYASMSCEIPPTLVTNLYSFEFTLMTNMCFLEFTFMVDMCSFMLTLMTDMEFLWDHLNYYAIGCTLLPK